MSCVEVRCAGVCTAVKPVPHVIHIDGDDDSDDVMDVVPLTAEDDSPHMVVTDDDAPVCRHSNTSRHVSVCW